MKTIKDNHQFYQEVQILSDELYALGYKNYQELIKEALSVSTVPGEIYGNLRNLLDCLMEEKINYKLKERITSMINYLDNILGPRNHPKL